MGIVVRVYWEEEAGSRAKKADVKCGGSTPELPLKLLGVSNGEAGGIPSGAVKCVDSRRNTSGEGGLLDDN